MKLYGKQTRSLRAVPMPTAAVEALAGMPPRVDTRLLFPGDRGGYLGLHAWRRDEWTPAVFAAGLAHRSPYALRHTYARFAIAAGVSLFELARFMGTSVSRSTAPKGTCCRTRSTGHGRRSTRSLPLRPRLRRRHRGRPTYVCVPSAYSPRRTIKDEKPRFAGLFSCRGAEIRTRDLLVPQTASSVW